MKYVDNTYMIILFGSYARGNYVLWETGFEFGSHYSFQSDLDILIIAHTTNPAKIEAKIEGRINPLYDKRLEHRRHAPPQIIVESDYGIDKALKRKQYFYSDIIKEGILLYDNGLFQLPKPLNLPFREIKEIAEDEYEGCYPDACKFLEIGHIMQSQQEWRIGSFQLHQACERFLYAILLVYTNYRPKCHQLPILSAMCRRFSRELLFLFPQDTPEELESYKKLCKAYIEARYNRLFTVSKEQFDYMILHTERLKELAGRLCAEQLTYYEVKAREEEKPTPVNKEL